MLKTIVILVLVCAASLADDIHQSEKILVQRVKTTIKTISLQWSAPKKLVFNLSPPQMMVYHYLLANRSEPLSGHRIPWTSKGVKIGLSSDQSSGSAIIEDLRPNSKYLVKVEDGEMNETLVVETKDGCYHNSTVYEVGQKFNISCQQICQCKSNSTVECSPRCEDQSREQHHHHPLSDNCKQVADPKDPKCCTIIQCSDDNAGLSRPKVLVTGKTITSLQIAWDDFKLPNYQSGYLVEYKKTLENSSKWTQIQANNTPFWKLQNLEPNTSYMVRISVWEDSEKIKPSSSGSEIITISTVDGCLRNNQTFLPGKLFINGCESRCLCRSNNTWDCEKVCKEPLKLIGSNQDLSCTEMPVDDCCARLVCASNRADTVNSSGGLTFSDKPGHCFDYEYGRNESDICVDECQHDYHCTGLLKCCPTSCGAICKEGIVNFNRCDATNCGPNAICVETKEAKELPKCVCRPGFQGNASDLLDGCRKLLTNKSNLVCEHNNVTYTRGEEFYDGCDLKCICSEALEIDCAPRCPFRVTETTHPDPLCSILEDPKDPCCKMIACESKPVITIESNSTEFNATNSETVPVNMPYPIVGCRHENETYQTGESFSDSCESRCVCKDGGRLECSPRCPEYKGYDERLCRLLPDPDDPECCKIAVCDLKENRANDEEKANENLQLIIESAKVYNSSNVLLRIIIPINNSDYHAVINNLRLAVFYSKVDTMHPAESIYRNWQKYSIEKRALDALSPSIFEVDFGGLEAATEYFVKIFETKSNTSSNPVFIKTFPAGIDSSFNGCFFANQTIQVGEEFYDGCEYKCVCREGGTRECEDRCPVYIDTIGYEGCEWAPSPDDSCCSIPICKNKSVNENEKAIILKEIPVTEAIKPDLIEPTTQPFCEGKDKKLHFIGDAWEESGRNGCLKQTCRCVQLANKTTIKRCHGGCPPIPPNALKPTKECLRPHMITPEDECLCPYVICDHIEEISSTENSALLDHLHKINTTTTTTEITLATNVTANLAGNEHNNNSGENHDHFESNNGHDEPPFIVHGLDKCEYNDRPVKVGKFLDGCSNSCECLPNGQINCLPIKCPQFFDAPNENCLEWELDPHFVPEPPNCCPKPLCKNDGSCFFAGLRFPNFKPIPAELLPCGTRCICMNGNVSCENRCPTISEVPPPNLPCPSSSAYRGHLPDDNCCVHWLCREPEKSASCLHNGNKYKIGEQWEDVNPANMLGPRRRCQCNSTPNGKPQVQCLPAVCPKITDRHLKPSLECPIPALVTPDDPLICPYVVCNYSEETGKELENVSLVAINNTAVRIRFTLPSLYVGLIGHAEVHFTHDPTIPRHSWKVQKFARPKRLFDTANIEYHLGGLRPDTTYFFQVKILVEALSSGPQSQVYKLHVPSEPIILGSSPTTASQASHQITGTSVTLPITSTLPPKILMDINLNVIPVDHNSLKIIWRPLNEREKAMIDGIKIRYKRLDEPSNRWLTTPMLHRDETEYVLENLVPGKSYSIDMMMRPLDGLNTQFISKPMTVDLPPQPRDELDFNILIDVDAESEKASIRIRGIPEPTDKHVQVIKVNYIESDPDQLIESKVIQALRHPTSDGTIVLDKLKSSKRYKTWVDLILFNGKTISSNPIIFTTKEGSQSTPVFDGSDNKLNNKYRDNDPLANEAEALKEGNIFKVEGPRGPFYVAFMVVAILAIITSVGFATLLCMIMKNKTCAKAAITRAPSEAAYDNPTYKTYDGEKPGDEPIKNGKT